MNEYEFEDYISKKVNLIHFKFKKPIFNNILPTNDNVVNKIEK